MSYNFYMLVLAENILKNQIIDLTHGCLYLGNVDGYAKGMYLLFALLQHVAPLCLQWPLAYLFPAAK